MRTKNRNGNKKATPLVLATVKPYTRNTLPDYTVASYTCACGHRGAVQAGLAKAHCSQCGGGVTLAKTVATANVIRVEKSANPISLECASCNKHNMMTVATAMGFKGKVHCSACGEGLEYDTSEIAGLDDDVDLDHSTDTGADDLSDTIGTDKNVAKASSDDDIDEVVDADDIEDAEDDEDGDYTTNASMDDDDEDIEDLEDETADADEDDEDDYLGGDAADNEDGETDDEDFDEEEEDESALASVKPTPIIATLKEKTLARSRLVKDGDRLHIFAGNHCVATAVPNTKNAKVFGNKTYASLIEESLANAGVMPTVKEFGFTLASIKVSKSKALETTVASIRSKAEAKVANQLKHHTDRFTQALQTASVGLNRDAFSDISNPLKDGVHNMLIGMGVEPVTAALKTQELFAKSGDQYAETLVTKAHELSALSDSGLNELATTFASLAVPTPNLLAIASDMEEDEEDEEDYLGDDENVTTASTRRLDVPMRQSQVAHVHTEAVGTGLFSCFSK